VEGSWGAYKATEAVPEFGLQQQLEDAVGETPTVVLYTILKDLRLEKYIRTGTSYMTCGTKNPCLATFLERIVKR
jgi:hypothetical protein